MMNEKNSTIESEMLLEAKQAIAEKRHDLDLIAPDTRKQIARILSYSDFGTDAWLICACSYLDGKHPLDVLKTDAPKVIEAAIRKSKWRNPG